MNNYFIGNNHAFSMSMSDSLYLRFEILVFISAAGRLSIQSKFICSIHYLKQRMLGYRRIMLNLVLSHTVGPAHARRATLPLAIVAILVLVLVLLSCLGACRSGSSDNRRSRGLGSDRSLGSDSSRNNSTGDPGGGLNRSRLARDRNTNQSLNSSQVLFSLSRPCIGIRRQGRRQVSLVLQNLTAYLLQADSSRNVLRRVDICRHVNLLHSKAATKRTSQCIVTATHSADVTSRG